MENKTLPEKMNKLRQAAEGLGICCGCLRQENDGKSRYCVKCKAQNAKFSAKYRKQEGRCSRCGQVNDRAATHKSCTKCLEYSRIAYRAKKQLI